MFLMITSVNGQIIFGQKSSAGVEFIFSNWTLKNDSAETTLSQLTFPLSGFVPLKDNLEARIFVGNAFNTLSSNDNDTKLSGLSDIRLQFNHSFVEDKFLMSLGINLPTGKKELSITDEQQVLEMLSQNYLTLPIRRLGEGFGFNLLAGGATYLGNVRGGLSIMYQFNGTYDPYLGLIDYDPGDFFSVSISADAKTSASAYAINMIFTTYTSDKVEDCEVFKQSNTFDVRLSGTRKMEKIGLSGSVRYLFRDRNQYYDVFSGDVISKLKSYGNEFSAYGRLEYHPNDLWYAGPLLEIKIIDASEEGLGSSNLFGLGAAYGRKLTDNVDIAAGLKYFIGKADDDKLDINGIQLSASLVAAF
jgi:hypothetical protein